MSQKVLFTSDLHGNKEQYKKLVRYAKENSPDIIIIGGDLAPKQPISHQRQKEFLEQDFNSYMKEIKENQPSSKIYVMMGNDDIAANIDTLEKNPDLYTVIHDKKVPISEKYSIVGYSYVPISPFLMKDWEKQDNHKIDIKSIENPVNERHDGVKSTDCGWKVFEFKDEDDSIEKDISKPIYTENPGETIYVFHTPPKDTNLDVIYSKHHVGSSAVKSFIEKHKPYVTLHGHIHECVDVSKEYKDILGDTVSLSAGNHNESDNLAILEFDIDKPKEAKRKMI